MGRMAMCPRCGGEYQVDSADGMMDMCEFCENINRRSDAVRYYMAHGSLLQTPAQRREEGDKVRRLFSVNFATATVRGDGSGYVDAKVSVRNNSPVPLKRLRIQFRIVDGQFQFPETNTPVTVWEESFSSPVPEGKSATFGSQDLYLVGNSVNLSDVYVFVAYVTAEYANGNILTVNGPLIKYIRDDHNKISDIEIQDTDARSKRMRPHHDGNKSWMVYLFLAVVVGGFGVHDFYAGNIKRGLIHLLLTITILGSPFSIVWAFIEGVSASTEKEVPDYGLRS